MLWCLLFARVKAHHRRVYSRTLVKVCYVTMATGWLKTRLKMVFVYFKQIQSQFFFHHFPTTNGH